MPNGLVRSGCRKCCIFVHITFKFTQARDLFKMTTIDINVVVFFALKLLDVRSKWLVI